MSEERMTESERTTLCRRIDELCAENERLRQENQSIGMAAYELGRKSMADENAKLRELVRWMYDRMDESCAAQYPYAPTPISYDRLMQALVRARELGIEVDA